jgi:hypothetical protein
MILGAYLTVPIRESHVFVIAQPAIFLQLPCTYWRIKAADTRKQTRQGQIKAVSLFRTVITLILFYPGATPPSGPRPPHYRGFMITHRHTTLGKTTLDEWSARRRDLYLTTHNTHKRHTSTPPAGFELAIPASERPQAHALDRPATGIGHNSDYRLKIPVIQLRKSQPDMANPVWFCVKFEDPYALHYQTPEELTGRHGRFLRDTFHWVFTRFKFCYYSLYYR